MKEHFARVVGERNIAIAAARNAALFLADAVMCHNGQINGELRERMLTVYRALYSVSQNGELPEQHVVEEGCYCEKCDLCRILSAEAAR